MVNEFFVAAMSLLQRDKRLLLAAYLIGEHASHAERNGDDPTAMRDALDAIVHAGLTAYVADNPEAEAEMTKEAAYRDTILAETARCSRKQF
jgi:hypothetical protein